MPAFWMLLLLLAGTGIAPAAEFDARLQAIRAEIADVERAIDRRFRDVQESSPMAMLGSSRGVYLSGYGALFTLEVNLAPMANLSPFRQSYTEEEKRQLNIRKRAKLEELEQRMREILVEECARIGLVPREERVGLVVSLFHFAWEDRTQLPSQMIMQSLRGDAADYAMGKLEKPEFLKKLSVKYF